MLRLRTFSVNVTQKNKIKNKTNGMNKHKKHKNEISREERTGQAS